MSDESPAYGHVKISRKAYESDPLWTERREFSRWEAWEDMIQFSSWGPRKVMAKDEIVSLARGEFLGSLRFLASRWAWTIKRVRTFLLFCIADERIRAQREAQVGTVYLLVNYEKYQGRGTPKGTPEAQRGHSAGTPEAQQGHKEEAGKQVSNEAKEKLPTAGVAVVLSERVPAVLTPRYEGVKTRIGEVLSEVVESGRRLTRQDEIRDVQTDVVFAYWAAKMNHPNALADAKRLGRIKACLVQNGGNIHELLYVIDGTRRDDHLMGRSGGKKYDGIDTIFRDRGQVERLAEQGGYKPGQVHKMAEKYAAIVEAA